MRRSSDYDDDDNEQDNVEEGGQDPDIVDELARLTRRVDLTSPSVHQTRWQRRGSR